MEFVSSMFLTGGQVIQQTANTTAALIKTVETDLNALADLLQDENLRTVEARLLVVRLILEQYVGEIDRLPGGWNAAAQRVGVVGATDVLKGLLRANGELRRLGGLVEGHKPVVVGGRWWGVFGSGVRGARGFGEEEVGVMGSCFYEVSVEVEKLRGVVYPVSQT
jgi:hypothetical protein